MTLADFVVVSVLGGLLASVGVGLATMGLAAGFGPLRPGTSTT
jgi:hypothetical protein